MKKTIAAGLVLVILAAAPVIAKTMFSTTETKAQPYEQNYKKYGLTTTDFERLASGKSN